MAAMICTPETDCNSLQDGNVMTLKNDKNSNCFANNCHTDNQNVLNDSNTNANDEFDFKTMMKVMIVIMISSTRRSL